MKSLNIAFIFIVCFCLMNKSYSQGLTLDEKRGFKDFTLGDPISKWKTSLKYVNTTDAQIAYYDYAGTCCQQVFNYNLASIGLGFKNDILQIICLTTEKQSDPSYLSNEYKSLKGSFTSLYGKPIEASVKTNDNLLCGWTGENVILTLEYEYLGVQHNSENVYFIASRCIINVRFKSDLKNGF